MYWLSKRVLPTPALVCADPALTLSYRLWSDRRIDGIVPARCQIDSPQFRLVIPDVQWLEISGMGGDTDRQKLPYGDVVLAQLGSPHPSSLLADALLDDVRLTAFTGSPMFQIIDLSQNLNPVTLQLLLLPFADNGSRTNEVMVVARIADFRLDFDNMTDMTATD